MQSDWKEIYRQTAERTGNSEQLYKDLGNFVFANLYKNLKKPKSLIIKLKGVGSWYLRKKRMETITQKFPPNFDKVEFDSEREAFGHQKRIDEHNIFLERLKDYDEYLRLRNQVRIKRNETQVLLKPVDDEN